ncbi:MAG: hypothetical protein ACT4N8_07545 [Sphingosinicella sp.]|uniref:hypothetical protein n=1 Tax=Sphingosinicella sp. TaxID=1917971 RepID=UPI004037BFA7
MGRPRPLFALVLFLTAPAAFAAQRDGGPVRQINITVYGEERCPEPEGDDIVVCARRPEEERYRIPPALRERTDRPAEIAWGTRNDVLEEDARTMRPDSCSVVGSGGQTGCTSALVRQWAAERRARRGR